MIDKTPEQTKKRVGHLLGDRQHLERGDQFTCSPRLMVLGYCIKCKNKGFYYPEGVELLGRFPHACWIHEMVDSYYE